MLKNKSINLLFIIFKRKKYYVQYLSVIITNYKISFNSLKNFKIILINDILLNIDNNFY